MLPELRPCINWSASGLARSSVFKGTLAKYSTWEKDEYGIGKEDYNQGQIPEVAEDPRISEEQAFWAGGPLSASGCLLP